MPFQNPKCHEDAPPHTAFWDEPLELVDLGQGHHVPGQKPNDHSPSWPLDLPPEGTPPHLGRPNIQGHGEAQGRNSKGRFEISFLTILVPLLFGKQTGERERKRTRTIQTAPNFTRLFLVGGPAENVLWAPAAVCRIRCSWELSLPVSRATATAHCPCPPTCHRVTSLWPEA